MKIAIVGGGFTGLSAAFYLSDKKHQVTIYEKEKYLGGLAATYKAPGWKWSVERHYHHWFTNDNAALSLINKLGLSEKIIFPKTLTANYYNGRIYPFNSPLQLLAFSPLSFGNRVRTGLITLALKLIPSSIGQTLESQKATDWIRRYFGEESYNNIWEPLLEGKFSRYKEEINMAWFWARIKKRTLRLGYLEGGYQTLVDAFVHKLEKAGCTVFTGKSFENKYRKNFDRVIVTTPSFTFIRMFPQLPEKYKKRLLSIKHLHALNLLLITKERILDEVYWLNINEKGFPFLAVVAQTNMIGENHYGGNHLTWIANYLPPGHPYLKMDKEELIRLYMPYLKKINPNINPQFTTHPASDGHRLSGIPSQGGKSSPWLDNYSQLFIGSFAQPIFPLNYSKIKPEFTTPLPYIYIANMDMVYPWDRGTNYAIEMGEKVASLIHKQKI